MTPDQQDEAFIKARRVGHYYETSRFVSKQTPHSGECKRAAVNLFAAIGKAVKRIRSKWQSQK